MDEATRQEISRVAARTLRDAGLTEPPRPLLMAMLVSTLAWAPRPEDQFHRWRHFDPSPVLCPRVSDGDGGGPSSMRRSGGALPPRWAVADFPLRLTDAHGETHDFRKRGRWQIVQAK
jgi:hypothetical protein